jgi:hypothetical protein
MNTREAEELLDAALLVFRTKQYAALVDQIEHGSSIGEVKGSSGVSYQIEIDFMWDHHPGGAVRVIGSIDDGGLRAFVPLTRSFIKAPDETFVGE